MGAQPKIESTVIGLKYPTGRDDALKTGTKWLEGKRQDDGAEGLWRVGDKLYDLEEWTKNHPGGVEWIALTRGTDITEAFEAHHLTMAAERLLPKFYIRDAVTPRASPFTFKPDGFYRKFKARAREALKDVDFHKPSRISKLITDSLFVMTLALSLVAAATQSWLAIIATGVVLTWTTIASHNFVHQRGSFRMYYMDMSLMSSKEWRITHALSHHLYTNTLLDIEITTLEPIFQYLPQRSKGLIARYLSPFYSPAVYAIVYFTNGIKRAYSVFWEFNGPEIRDLMPFVLPTLMCFVAPPATAIVTWLKIIAAASVHFCLVAFNGSHHHPDIFHDGDAYRDDYDWGLSQLDTVRDRTEVQASFFLILTHFGDHSLHHLLPAVDHGYLHLCEPAFAETCKEFNVNTDCWPSWELMKGQFKQLTNVQPKLTPNSR